MLRVCIVSAGLPPFYGGAELRAFRQAQRLQTIEGIKAILIGWDRAENRVADNFFPPHVHAVKLHLQEGGGTQTPASLVKLLLHLGELGARLGSLLFTLRHEFDVVHIINAVPWFNLVPIPFAKALNKPVILEMTSLGTDDPLTLNRRSRHPEQQIFPHRPLKYTLFLKADAYVSKCHALSAAYRDAGLPGSRLFQIPSGVDTQKFKPPTSQEKQALRHKLGLTREQMIILKVGAIKEDQGVHRLVAAFREIAPHYSQAHLLIVGPTSRFDPFYIQAIHEDVAAWGLSERVTFVENQVENVDEYMKAADVFAHPSSREGMSNVILEAMASGLAIVASDIPEIALSQIQHGVEGILAPVGDIRQWAEALTELISSSAVRARLGRAARQRALREFDVEIVDSQYIRLYRGLCSADCQRTN